MKTRKAYISIFVFVTFLYWSSLFSNVSVLSGYAEDIGATAAFVGIISGSYGISQVLLRLPLGFLSDKTKKRKIFITGALGFIVAAGIIMFLTNVPEGLLLGRIICGVAGCAFVQITILFSSYFDEDKTSKSISLIVAISNLSQMAGMLMGGFAGNMFGKKYVFLLTALLAGAGFLLSFFILDKPADSSFDLRDFKGAVKRKGFIVSSLLAVICLILAYGKSFTFVPLLANRIGASPFEQSVVASIFSLATIAAALFCGRCRANIKTLITAGFIFHAAGSFVLLLKATTLMLYLSQSLSGVGNGLIFSLLMSVSLKGVNENLRGTSMGIFQAVYGIGMILGPVLLGAVVEGFSMNAGFVATGILSLMGAVLSLLFI